MNQIFHPSMNTIARISIFGAVFVLILIGVIVAYFVKSSFVTEVKVPIEQPVQFSHQHHVEQLGIDCRYCHTSVENAAFAGIPPTETCMTCHSQIWTEAPMLEPVRESFRTGIPIPWNRVHDLSDFVYFNHSIHIRKGVGCETCHGRVDQMPLTWKDQNLFMAWCLDCHRDPGPNLRPLDQIFTMGWTENVFVEEQAQLIETQDRVAEYGIEVGRLDDCSICHR